MFHKWDRGNHSIKYGTLAFPDAMRWLWKGYPARVQKGWSNNGMLQEILLVDSEWQELEAPKGVMQLFAAEDSSVVFAADKNIYKVSSQGDLAHIGMLKSGERLMGDGLTARGTSLYKNGQKVADGLYGLQAVQALEGNTYVVLCDTRTKSKNNVWVVNAGCRALADRKSVV